jgi:hypothetical protein
MALQTSGPISLTDIATEVKAPLTGINLSDFYRGGKYVPVSFTKIPASGSISLSDFYGMANSTAGEMRWDTVGTFDWVCPAYTEMYCECVGGSGGPGSSVYDGGHVVGSGTNGLNGENSGIDWFIAGGGGGGGGGGQGGRFPDQARPGVVGPPGGAGGGDVNTSGGGLPGGAGVGYFGDPRGKGGDGGASGKASIKWKLGDQYVNQRAPAPIPGATYKVTVGPGGAPGSVAGAAVGTPGVSGYVYVKWV